MRFIHVAEDEGFGSHLQSPVSPECCIGQALFGITVDRPVRKARALTGHDSRNSNCTLQVEA